MARRNWFWTVLIGPLCLLLLPRAVPAAAQSHRPPNVVLIISDDQAWTDFGFMKHSPVRTPHIDRLAARSAVFRRGYVPTSLCRPSLATIISGLYPHQHGITGNDPPKGTDRSAMLHHIRDVPTLPRLLATRGYRSFQTGKWWEGNYSEAGFTAGMSHGDPKKGGRHGDEGLRIGRQGLGPIFDFINSCKDRPYLVWYAPMMPHLPHDPPKRLLIKYMSPKRPMAEAKYFAMCEWFDETCGQLLDFIDRKKQTRNTLVVFVVDNGWITPHSTNLPYAPRSKNSPYDGGLRTPILVSMPGTVATGDYATLVSSIDIAPTILAAAGLPKPSAMPGLNLLNVIDEGGRTSRTAVFGEVYNHDVADIDNPVPGLQFRWCIDGKWKLIRPFHRPEKPELYDVVADPFESKNVAAKRPDLVDKLSGEVDGWWRIKDER